MRSLTAELSYCNSILQSLYYTASFRANILKYPQAVYQVDDDLTTPAHVQSDLTRILPPTSPTKSKATFLSSPGESKRKSAGPSTYTAQSSLRQDEQRDSTEAKKRAALLAGPILSLETDHSTKYGLQSTLFSALRDIYEAVGRQKSRTGVISPKRFAEVLRRDNEMYKSPMHQDAHEFLNYLLNVIMECLEDIQRQQEKADAETIPLEVHTDKSRKYETVNEGVDQKQQDDSCVNTKWVQELISGTLLSETKCLTCENSSHRDEPFLDLSIDLEQHSSVTSCLQNFSAPEMLCERNKFHCDKCGGLQEAEKRLKFKRLPKVLAIHLKRFKWMEEAGRLQKLFHRVVYPTHLRLGATTGETKGSEKLYELYAVVIHIGSGPYHGHYVSVIKTQARGWLLFDDELVEPVPEDFVNSFYGDLPGQACAYVLFYQESQFPDTVAGQETRAPVVKPSPKPSIDTAPTPVVDSSVRNPHREVEVSAGGTPIRKLDDRSTQTHATRSENQASSQVRDDTNMEKGETGDVEGAPSAAPQPLMIVPPVEDVKLLEQRTQVSERSESTLSPNSKLELRNGRFRNNPISRVAGGKAIFKMGQKTKHSQSPNESSKSNAIDAEHVGSTPTSPAFGREGRKTHIFGGLRRKGSVL